MMLTRRWLPFAATEWNRLQREMDQIFNRVATDRFTWPGLAYSYPPVNVWEDAEHLYVEAELPGMDLEKLEIYVTQGNQLTIQGEREVGQVPQGVWHRQERGFGEFSRTIALPFEVDADHVEARFDRGVLRVTLPKHEVARPRQIPVKVE